MVKTNDGYFVVETKGREDVDVQYKDKRAREWGELALKLTKEKWGYLRIDQKDYEARVWKEFGELVQNRRLN